jgi:hypothetical protein
LVTTDRHVDATSVGVSAARRQPGAPFGRLADVSTAQFVSDAFGAQAAMRDGGRALVTWASGLNPSVPAPTGLFAATSNSSGVFGAPQLLADAQTATLPQPTGAAISSASALVAWVGPQGARVARTSGP